MRDWPYLRHIHYGLANEGFLQLCLFPLAQLQGFDSRCGLGVFFTASCSFTEIITFSEDAHNKSLCVLWPCLRNQFIDRAPRRDRLQQLLEMTFRVYIDRIFCDQRKLCAHLLQDEAPHCRKIAVEINGARQSFES